ncbi:MAG: fluoride efflux transporter FluC [Methanobacteriota archaeon]
MDWKLVGLVAAGSALGGAARFLVQEALGKGAFPWGTFAVNVAGCFAIGVVLLGGLGVGGIAPHHRTVIAAGVLGGFTTMSAFAFETIALLEAQAVVPAATYVTTTVAACLASTWAGRALGALLSA